MLLIILAGHLREQHLSEPTDYQQEKQIQALCREVTGLVMQLSQRDSLINSLHEERDRSAKVINELKLSQGLSSSSVSEAMRSTGEFRDKLEAAFREKQEALEREARATARLKDLQVLYKKCEAARSALCDGLERAEEQTTALHAQWVQEKKDMFTSVKKDDQKSAKFAAEYGRLRQDNEALKASLRQSSENEKKHLSAMETQRQVVDKSQTHIAQLTSELNLLRPQLRVLNEKEARISALESDLSGAREKLRRCLIQVDALEERLEQREEEVQASKAQFQERAAFLEQRVFDVEAVRRSLHNKVSDPRHCWAKGLPSFLTNVVGSQVMELKGNIRVFCRVRPVLRHELASSRGEEVQTAFAGLCYLLGYSMTDTK